MEKIKKLLNLIAFVLIISFVLLPTVTIFSYAVSEDPKEALRIPVGQDTANERIRIIEQQLTSNAQIKQVLEDALIFVEGYGVCSKMSLWPDRRKAIKKDNKALQDAGLKRVIACGPTEVMHVSAKESIERIEEEFFRPLFEKVKGLEPEKSRLSLERFLDILHQEIIGVIKRYIEHEEEISAKYGYIVPEPGINITTELRGRLNRLFSLQQRESFTIPPKISKLDSGYRRHFSFSAIRYDFKPEGLSLLTTQPAYSIFSKDRLEDTLANVRILETLDRLEEELKLEGVDKKELGPLLENHIRDFFHSIGANYVHPPTERIVEKLEDFTKSYYEEEFGKHIEALKELGIAILHSNKEVVSRISKNRQLKDILFNHGIILTQGGEAFMYYTPHLAMFADIEVAFIAIRDNIMSISSKEALDYLEEHPDLARKIKTYSPRLWAWPLAESQNQLDRHNIGRFTPKNFSITPDWVYSAARRFLNLEILIPSEEWKWRPVTDWQGQIVDFGIGTGEFFYQIARTIRGENTDRAKQEYFGVDISGPMVDVARQRGYTVDQLDISNEAALSEWKKRHGVVLKQAVCMDTLQHLNREGRENFLRWFMNNAEDNARLFVSLIFEDQKVSRDDTEQEIASLCFSLGITEDNIQLERQGNRTFFYILKPPAKLKEVIGAVTPLKLTIIKREPDVYPGNQQVIRILEFADGHEQREAQDFKIKHPGKYNEAVFRLIETRTIQTNNGEQQEIYSTYRNINRGETVTVLASEKNIKGNKVHYQRNKDNPGEITRVEVDLPGSRYKFIAELSNHARNMHIIVADIGAKGFSKPLLKENCKFRIGLTDSEIRSIGLLNIEDILKNYLHRTINSAGVQDILLNRVSRWIITHIAKILNSKPLNCYL